MFFNGAAKIERDVGSCGSDPKAGGCFQDVLLNIETVRTGTMPATYCWRSNHQPVIPITQGQSITWFFDKPDALTIIPVSQRVFELKLATSGLKCDIVTYFLLYLHIFLYILQELRNFP